MKQPLSPLTHRAPQLTTITSEHGDDRSLPDILIDSAAYQEASVVEAVSLDESSDDSDGEVAELPSLPITDPALEPAAIVNLRCTYTTDDYVRATTGTGFMVSPDGVILTNAHVAFFLLLRDIEGEGETVCVVNTGAESAPQYAVDILYLPPA